MRRTLLIGMVSGAALALASAAIASIWHNDKRQTLYLRIADDNFDHLLAPDHQDEDGPISAKLARRCGINKFTLDLAVPDHTGSAFVELETTPPANLNCLIGEARVHALSLAIVDGMNITSFECLPGWPSRFQKVEGGNFELCQGRNPDPIFKRDRDAK